MGSVLPHFPQSGAVAQRRWQDDRDVTTQSCSDKWKFGQGGEKEIHAPTSVHIAPLEKGKDTSCEGGAAAEGEGGGCYKSDARIGWGTCQPGLPDCTSELPRKQLQAARRG